MSQNGLEFLNLKELRNSYGDHLVVQKELDYLPLWCRKGSSTTDQFYKDLALAFDATYSKSRDNVATLIRSNSDSQKFDSKRTSWRQDWLLKSFSRVEQFRAKSPIDSPRIYSGLQNEINLSTAISAGSGDLPRALFPGQLIPSFQYVEFALKKIPLSNFSSVPDGVVSVWEDNPVAGSKLLPEHTKEDAHYLESRSLLHELPFAEGQKDQFSKIGESESFSDWGQTPIVPKKLRLQLNSFEGELSLRIEGFDQIGKRFLFTGLTVFPRDVWLSPYFIARPPSGGPPDQIVELTGNSLSLVTGLKQPLMTDTNYWMQALSERNSYEEASQQAVEYLDSKDKNKNFIFVANDDTVRAVTVATTDNKLNLSFFKRLLLQFFNYEVVETASSVIWRPAYELQNRRSNADIAGLLETIQSANKSGFISAKDLCRFYNLIDKSTFTTRVCADILRQSESIKRPSFSASPDMLNFLGGLDDEAWTQLLSGKSLTLDELGGAASFRKLVKKDTLKIVSNNGQAVPDLYQHAGELFQQDFFGSVTAQMSSSSSNMVGEVLSTSHGLIRWFDQKRLRAPLRVTYRYPLGKDPEVSISREDWEKHVEDYMSFRLGSQHSIEIRFELPFGFHTAVQFTDPVLDDGITYSYRTLPTELKDKLWKAALDTPPI